MSENFNFISLGDLRSSQPQDHVRASSSASTEVDGGGGGMNSAHDNLLPIANVGRIMKDVLPPQAKISKRAKETIQECATEFIGFVTGEASERCRRERCKTINGDDICHAMRSLGLDNYADTMRRYLQRYRESEELAMRSLGLDNYADTMRRYLQRYRESEELAAAINSSSGREIQIDVRDELSIFRGSEQRQDKN